VERESLKGSENSDPVGVFKNLARSFCIFYEFWSNSLNLRFRQQKEEMGIANEEAIKQLQSIMEEGELQKANFEFLWSSALIFELLTLLSFLAVCLKSAVDEPLKKTFKVSLVFLSFW
jgi:hypothetical protein